MAGEVAIEVSVRAAQCWFVSKSVSPSVTPRRGQSRPSFDLQPLPCTEDPVHFYSVFSRAALKFYVHWVRGVERDP